MCTDDIANDRIIVRDQHAYRSPLIHLGISHLAERTAGRRFSRNYTLLAAQAAKTQINRSITLLPMRIPEILRHAIDSEAARVDRSALARASANITAAYKAGDFSKPALKSDLHRLAYALVRMPATFAANLHVAKELRERVPSLTPKSVLDLGAGPGTSMWALTEVFPSIERFVLIERDAALAGIGNRIAAKSDRAALQRAQWESADLANSSLSAYDLIIASYSLGELPRSIATALVRRCWTAAQQVLVLIEPGTRRGFDTILNARAELVRAGAALAAPCPHHDECPMAAVGDWCHFAQRIERTSEHRRLKDGSLGYEDEKFSYLAASKYDVKRRRARILRHPMKFSGHVKLQLCSGPIPEQQTITRSHKDRYRIARHAEWGDAWDF